jgi:hypothetical protein
MDRGDVRRRQAIGDDQVLAEEAGVSVGEAAAVAAGTVVAAVAAVVAGAVVAAVAEAGAREEVGHRS